MKFQTYFTNKPEKITIDQSQEVSKTRQSEKDSCDINKIMERFNRTGQLPRMQEVPARYGEAIALDYATSLNLINEAQEKFMELPANVRKHFGNDPSNYLNAISDASPENAAKLLELGILIKKEKSAEELLMDIAQNTKPKEEA